MHVDNFAYNIKLVYFIPTDLCDIFVVLTLKKINEIMFHFSLTACSWAILMFTTIYLLKAGEHEERFFHLVGTGVSLSRVIARYTSQSWLDCGQRCTGERSCVGFNFNDRLMNKKNRHNCELTDEPETPESRASEKLNKDSNWKHYQGIFPLGSYALPGKSCADILQNAGLTKNLPNGEYWIKVDTAGPMRVYCDMKTSKGGWTLVYNIALQTSHSFPFAVEKNWKAISNYTTGKIALTAGALGDLMRKMPFEQLRFHCFKKNPGRTFHVVTRKNERGGNVVRYFTAQTDDIPKSCFSFDPLFDDNSELSPNCSKWKRGGARWSRINNPDTRLIDHTAYIYGTHHWYIQRNRWECDDHGKKLSPGDFWKIFVR